MASTYSSSWAVQYLLKDRVSYANRVIGEDKQHCGAVQGTVPVLKCFNDACSIMERFFSVEPAGKPDPRDALKVQSLRAVVHTVSFARAGLGGMPTEPSNYPCIILRLGAAKGEAGGAPVALAEGNFSSASIVMALQCFLLSTIVV